MMPMMQKVSSDITIVNPLTLEEKDLVRLAAYIDGEGTIALQYWNATKPGVHSMQAKISVFNSNPVFVGEVVNIYNRLGVKVYIENQKRKPNHKIVYRIIVMGINRVHRVLTAIKPYLVAKKGQADAVMEFCELRMKAAKIGRGKVVRYSQRELELHNQVKLLNLRGVSETENCEPQHFNVAGV